VPVTYEVRKGVAVIAMDDGKANAIDLSVLEELGACLDQTDADPAVLAVLLTGRPGRFSAGFDLAAMTAGHDSMKQLVMAGGRFVARLLMQPHPVVAACTGHALAAGGLILLACDYRVGAAGDWKIGLNEVAIGLAMPRWGVELARYRLAPTRLEWCLTLGQTGSPSEAVDAGFLDRVEPADDVLDEAEAVARRLAHLRTKAVGGTKDRLRGPVVARMLEDMDADLDGIEVRNPPETAINLKRPST
jgi:enoyl-CoA hydratase